MNIGLYIGREWKSTLASVHTEPKSGVLWEIITAGVTIEGMRTIKYAGVK